MPLHSFETEFRIPSHHRLEQVRTRARGGLVAGFYWAHHEYDLSGRLVAHYDSFQESCAESDASTCGWRKYDGEGRLIKFGVLPALKKKIPLDET